VNKRPDRTDSVSFRKRARAAAVSLFARYGFEGTSVQAIADKVGASKQTLLYHFSSKEGLRDAVLTEMVEVWRNLLPRFLSALTRQEAPLEEALAEVLAFFREEPAYARFLMQELLQTARGQHPIVVDIEPWLKVAADLLRRAQSERRVDPEVDPEAWLVNIGTLLLGTLSLLGKGRGGPEPERVVREMARIMGSSLVRKHPASRSISSRSEARAPTSARASRRLRRRA
jgi:TetR/AcrR family transcriptional regulator